MNDSPSGEATRILVALENDKIESREAMDKLYPIVYQELRRVASGMMRTQQNHTLQPTALVHEAFLKLVRSEGAGWTSRTHFFRVAAKAMRQILINYARDRAAEKRGGGQHRVTLDENLVGAGGNQWLDLIALDTALERLAENDERMAKVVEFRVFAGMTVPEIAHVLEVSPRTVDNYWKTAKMFLLDELDEREDR